VNKQFFIRFILVLLALSIILFLSPANAWWVRWYDILQAEILDLLLDSGRIIGIALILAGLLAPFEALGWWAGWYGGDRERSLTVKTTKSRVNYDTLPHYVVYLDGIGKSSFKYSSITKRFLERLEASLPSDRILIYNIIPYSAIGVPLTIGRPLARFWQWIEQTSQLEFFILLRNMFQVAVSVDSRYGPIYNRGTAQIIIDRLLDKGYQPGSGALITLIGYSGGGQISLGAVPYLKKVLAAPIEVISLAGVISGNNEVVQVEHLYYLVGEKDRVARLTPLLFPQRWSFVTWSNWNLAKTRGEISFVSLGKMGHDSTNGPLDENALLADGCNHLEKTLRVILRILTRADGEEPYPAAIPNYRAMNRVVGDYENYVRAEFNRPDYYPISQSYSPNYLPVAQWLGRLILPEATERSRVSGVYFEVHHAPPSDRDLIGRQVYLRWSDRPDLQAYVNQVKIRIDFSEQAYQSIDRGIIHPTRLNHWRQVQALESLAAARPNDDVMVALTSVKVAREGDICLYISREPIVITGKYYALVTVRELLPGDRAMVRHYNPASREFDGAEELIYFPSVVPDGNGVLSAITEGITASPLNSTGWYIYGAKNHQGIFTVQAIAPRVLFQLQPTRVISGRHNTTQYIHHQYWQGARAKKGQIDSILLNPRNLTDTELINSFSEGDRLLVLHTYGGIGGKKREFAPLGLFFGHFAFGLARVIREPLTDRLRFKLRYAQVYTQNTTGIIAASLDWTNFAGDRQFGWLGSRPITDIIVKLDVLEEYNFAGLRRFPLNALAYQLDRMMARYRTGDGTGATFVGPANSCVQDSCQALYLAIDMTLTEIKTNPQIQNWIATYPQHPQTQRLQRLIALNRAIKAKLISWQTRPDWVDPYQSLIGTRLADRPVNTIVNALTSWRSLLPRLANDVLAEIFLNYGASLWLLQTYQVGGWDGDIEPIAPTKLWI
jgi:predicted Abi (CAAX) family protease